MLGFAEGGAKNANEVEEGHALTTICHLAIVNVCVIIMSIGNTQIGILLLCFQYLFTYDYDE